MQLRFGLAAALNRMAAPHRAALATRGTKADGQFFSPANAAQRIEDLLAHGVRRITWATQVSPTNLLASDQKVTATNKEQRQQEC